MAGLTTEGFIAKTLEEIRASMIARMQAKLGDDIDATNAPLVGVVIGVVAGEIAEAWDAAEEIYAAWDPDAATGAALRALAALSGTLPEGPVSSSVELTLTGVPTTVVASGSRAALAAGDLFETLAEATLVALVARANSTAYALGDRRTHGGNAYQASAAGTSAGSGGPSATDPLDLVGELDGTVRWRYLGEGTAAVDVEAAAVETGPLTAASGTITEIDTAVAGWDGVINLLDADIGRNDETDEDLRTRRELELAAAGSSPVPAIRAAILKLDGVVAATVFYNPTDSTDADGVPPHAIEVLVRAPETAEMDQAIWDALYANVAAGIETHGDEVGTVTDSEGIDQTYRFSRPDEIPIYVVMTVTKDPDEYPSDGTAQIKDAIVAFGDAQATGKNAVAAAIGAQAFQVAGVLDTPTVFIGTAPAPGTSATVAISLREIAVFDSSFITVTPADGTP